MLQSGRPKRHRALQACEVCRTRKNRCSEDQPCTYCVDHGLECSYSRVHRDRRPRSRPIMQIESQRMGPDSLRLHQSPVIESEPNNVESWPNAPSHAEPVERTSTRLLPTNETRKPSALSSMNMNSAGSVSITPQRAASDVMDTNLHTSNLEFYGSSSSVAFLRHMEMLSNSQTTDPVGGQSRCSLASLLHNTEFCPDTPHDRQAAPEASTSSDRFHFRVARRFLDTYFSNIHHIQPIFDEDVFLSRCEDLWFNTPEKQPLSFVALYYATLSLGSLVMTFETPEIAGADRFTWSRRLFNRALAIVTRLGTTTDIEMVQCFYMMSKIYQHELNPHVAYLYSGQAARTSLAIGINRRPISPDVTDPRASMMASKTWWAVYCLDIQTSFALGRPDSLGPDEYHTQDLPIKSVEEARSNTNALDIVPCMVHLSRIMRQVALALYTVPCEMDEKLQRAQTLDAGLCSWHEQIPASLRIDHHQVPGQSLKPSGLASRAKKQSVVLQLRYLNLRMIVHAAFMTQSDTDASGDAMSVRECQCKCLEAAESTIDLIYNTFLSDHFFQTWWYNATYTLFAVSILLAAVFQQLATSQHALDNLFVHIDRAVLILQAMDECLVARTATAIIKRSLARAKRVPQPALDEGQGSSTRGVDFSDGALLLPTSFEQTEGPGGVEPLLQPYPTAGVIDEEEAMGDLDWLNSYPLDDSKQASFWTRWAQELEVLGT
ncbi:Fungal specific transcription factor domain-containing protein [Cladophialophora immunda]|nr:Fungal specific transcription factor domain-containing protein [Cladophialophora immunda]